jgi:cell division protein FtsA
LVPWPGENRDNEIVSIPGLRGREPKNFFKKLVKIIHARVVEIVEQVLQKSKPTDTRPSQEINRRYCPHWWWRTVETHQTVSRIHYGDGYKNRISNEHLAGDSDEEFSSPLYATAVGLVMNGIENQKQSAVKIDEVAVPKAAVYRALSPRLRREGRKK